MHLDWLKTTRLTVAHGGATAKAIDYSLKHWSALTRYATNDARSTTTPWETPSALCAWARRIGYSPVLSAPAVAPPPS